MALLRRRSQADALVLGLAQCTGRTRERTRPRRSAPRRDQLRRESVIVVETAEDRASNEPWPT